MKSTTTRRRHVRRFAGFAIACALMAPGAYAVADTQQGGGGSPGGADSAPAQSPIVNVIVQVDAQDAAAAPGGLGAQGASSPEQVHRALQDRVRAIASTEAVAGKGLGAQSSEALDDIELVCDYYNAFDGFAVSAPRNAIDDIRALPGVKAAFEEHVYEAPESMAADGGKGTEDNASALAMVGADAVSQKGDGQVVAVIDTGVYVDHEAFKGDAPDEGKKWTSDSIAATKAGLTQGGKNALYVNEKIPFAWNYGDNDSNLRGYNEHGTHVAGISVANAGEMRGMAPNAQLLAMRVARSYDGGMGDTAILAALDDCVVLRPDVINMSLGTDGGFFDEATNIYAEAFGKLESNGCTLCISAGNAYYSTYRQAGVENHPLTTDPDVGTIATPSAHAESFSVASAENAASLSCFTAADGTKVAYRQAADGDGKQGKKLAELTDGDYAYVLAGLADDDILDSLKTSVANFSKTVVVMDNSSSDELSFFDRLEAVAGLAPAAIVVYDISEDTPADVLPNIVTGEPSQTGGHSGSFSLVAADASRVLQAAGGVDACPVVGVKRSDAQLLADAAEKAVALKSGQTIAASGSYQMSDFSSWGVTPEMKLKPEITGPGGNIYSTVYDDKYDYMSGTSMSSPAVAGLAALVNEYIHEDAKFAALDEGQKHDRLYQLMMSTAAPMADARVEGSYYSPRQQGAGLVNVAAALETPVYLMVDGAVDPSRPKAELGSSKEGSWSFTVTLHNMGDEPVAYKPDTAALSEQIRDGRFQMRSENYTGRGIDVAYSGEAYDGEAGTVSVGPHAEASYTVSIECTDAFKSAVAAAKNGTFVEGFAMLRGQGGVPDLSVPFLGFLGDWGAVPVFDERAGSGTPAHIQATQLYSMNGSANGPLGANPFAFYTSSDKIDLSRAVISRSNVSGTYISGDVATVPSSVVPHTGLLRSPASMEYIYRNEAGEEISRFSYPFLQKSLYVRYMYPEADIPLPLFSGYDAKGAELPDGKYTLEERATVAGTDSVQTQQFEFFLDTAAPSVSELSIVGEGDSRRVEFNVTDETFLAAVDFVDDSYDNRGDGEGKGFFYRIDASAKEADEVDSAGRNVYRFSVALADLEQAWTDAGHDGSVEQNLRVCAWDFGLNGSAYADAPSDADFVVEGGKLVAYTGKSTHVAVPEGVTEIAEGAFAYSRARMLEIPSSVKTIGKRAFYQAMGLMSVTFADSASSPSSLRSIGEEAFAGTGLSTIVLPDSVVTVGKRAFAGASAKLASFGKKARIDETTFEGANPKRVVMAGANRYKPEFPK